MTGGINYLLAIAIDEYKNFPRLYNCRRDAEAFIQLLTEHYAFEPANVTALFDAEATLDQIDAVFEHLIDRVKPHDNLVIYYSGHGEYSGKRQEGFWIPVDAAQGKYTQYLANDSIRRFINQIKTYHTFLISDSCFSGSLFESGKGENTGDYLEEDPSRWVLTAGRNEIVSDGKPGGSSPFAEALQYQLKKDRDFIGVAELCVYVQKEVKAGAFGKTNQMPVFGPLHVEGNKFGQFVFRRKKTIAAVPKSDPQEESAWRIARSANSFAGYQEYLRLFPNGAHYLEAIDLLGQLIGKAEAPPASAPVVVPKKPELVLPEMIFVKGGTFTMGCTKEQGGDCYDSEKPAHKVTVKDFSIGKYPVTQAQWKAVMGNNPSRFSDCEDCPVERVSWDDAQKYIKKLNQLTGEHFRLPTEAEWEFAARGGIKSKGFKYAGSDKLDEVGWYDGNSGSKTYPVGKKAPNELGIYDMSGNVWEWCADWYDDYPSDAQTNPEGPIRGSYRVSRGGSWGSSPRSCRVSNRDHDDPAYRYDGIGFRLARSL